MRDWYHDRRTDIGLRLGGAALCGLAWLAFRELAALHLSRIHADPGAGALLLAAAGFLCASLGAVLITQGRHIFDSVEVSERWRTARMSPVPPTAEAASMNSPTLAASAVTARTSLRPPVFRRHP
ncbi:hypothetical protein [Sphingopyxis sp.]|uniref:hypothetical protein n=1 Tax=Sphingopyxis sp. TaxID=1908224 RepID=UPI002FCC85CC